MRGSSKARISLLLHPGYGRKNYYGAGIDSRLEMLRPRMS